MADDRIAVYSKHSCPSGVDAYVGLSRGPSGPQLAEKLGKLCPAHLIVDLNRAECSLPAEAEAEYLFDWLPEAARPIGSPVLVSAPAADLLAVILASVWGKDCLVCLYSRKNASEVLGQVRLALRGGVAGDGPPARMTGLCWPEVLRPLLEQGVPETAELILAGIDVVLVESEDGSGWRAYSRGNFSGILNRLGFAEQSDEEAAPG